ncbi:hypothetical protein ACG83_10075 [Frankia sp. R43]|uniref:hypothetical protein n=1 Tax=Frankia sp. R43 TaxID=269536 RepID=UPI0006CA4F07|nr:hypothetical protein [Frankia sp. R43]KPM55630.1 hypothetical protein ACG83_10075 [Frankia sp. R43]
MIEKLYESDGYTYGAPAEAGVVGRTVEHLPRGTVTARTFYDVGMDEPAPELSVELGRDFTPLFGSREDAEGFRDWLVGSLDAGIDAAWPQGGSE